ncbi:MAG TPA: WYL domain-containing protein [Vicinamibacteria bacterium]|jgi:predicted DNA-binding transcriptional regulator YafY|nr:WYL domain-containing protein [Vicinamibacteria bacterium]
MRNAEVIRQWKILKRIEAGRYTTAQDMADEHGVTERTIRRDIEALQEAGFPLYDERSDGHKVWRLVEGYKQKLTQTFTLAELAALYFGKNLMSFLGGAPFAQDLEAAFAKIREALPARSLPYLARIQDLFSARPDPWKDYSNKQDVIAAVIDATLHQRQMQIAYFSFNSRRTKTYTLDPYRVVYYHGGLYLYARAHEYGEVRTFAVERIQKIEVLDQNFETPRDFNVSEYARGAFGIAGGKPVNVEIVFDAEMAGYIRERVWHESQTLEDGPEGAVVLRMSVAPGWELRSWLKGFLPHARVIQPLSLRDEIAGDLEGAREHFPPPRAKR